MMNFCSESFVIITDLDVWTCLLGIEGRLEVTGLLACLALA